MDRAESMLQMDMLLTENGTPMTPLFAEAGYRRGNIPNGIKPQLHGPDNPEKNVRLWVVDRILEPQTVPQFLSYLSSGRLPDGTQTPRELPTFDELKNITRPFSDWAPAPYNNHGRPTAESIGVRIGSFEDRSRLFSIAKELHSMKSRIWEGLPPLSERRWKELELDDPKNFSEACHYLVAVINAFHYLNHRRVKDALRTTFNLIWNHLRVFEQALNACRRSPSWDGPREQLSITSHWYEYIKSHYSVICKAAHHWVITHIERLRDPITEQLGNHQPQGTNELDSVQWDLTNKIHDLSQNTSHADFVIDLPTDGYKGDPLPSQDDLRTGGAPGRGFREQPIVWSANCYRRRVDISARVRYLHRKIQYDSIVRLGLNFFSPDTPPNDPAAILHTTLCQVDAMDQARLELRGTSEPPSLLPWISYARHQLRGSLLTFGYVAYRLCHQHSSEEWDDFRAKFDADISDWGRDISNIDDIRDACKIHWMDSQELGIPDGDIEAAKEHFNTYIKSEGAPPVQKRVLLIIDEHVIKSYLDPIKDVEKFVVVAQADYDPVFEEESVESPGYKGTVRVLGSLLWDDLGAMLLRQSVFVDWLWPLAMGNPGGVYKGPKITPVWKFTTHSETLRWEIGSRVIPWLVRYKHMAESRGRRST
ncbi:hypothetical protein NM208_g14053 [Fusarium decemcellulare]|uniref:Uncharacterized protein n=1 Tax=Fusarium decemcellulare TaxID=57161 RepID=A0ACC1RI49_9HYPO|nr:hypothetical protein NM208_g14053 [Fusarium decemcellulare]